jgi:hypothetical protein
MGKTPVDLTVALVDEIKAALPAMAQFVERRYRPRRDRSEFEQGRVYITVYMEALHRVERVGREVDRQTYAVGVVIQQAAPIPENLSDAAVDGNDDLDWGDAMVALVDAVEGLWLVGDDGAAGPLRRRRIEGYEFTELLDVPLFEADHLAAEGVWTSVVVPIYTRGSSVEDE